jgi:glucose-1-phosphate thymidylyltransferase
VRQLRSWHHRDRPGRRRHRGANPRGHGRWRRLRARFTYIRQDAPLGIAHGLGICRTSRKTEPVLYLGDNVLLGGITAFVEQFAASAPPHRWSSRVDDPRAFGVAVVAGERLQRVVKKPPEPPSNLAVIGVYAFRPEVFDIIRTLAPSPRGEYEIADAINGLIGVGRAVEASVTAAYWIDTGKMEDMLAANRAILDTCAEAIDPAATIIGGSRSGTAVIGAGARLEECTLIGPSQSVPAPNCETAASGHTSRSAAVRRSPPAPSATAS